MASDYDVGYGKPPKNRQFGPSKSGNPKGRPKGSMNVATMFTRISHEMIHVTENGKTKMMSRVEAVLLQMATGRSRVMHAP